MKYLVNVFYHFTATIRHKNKDFTLLERVFIKKKRFRDHLWLESKHFNGLHPQDMIEFEGKVTTYRSYVKTKDSKTKKITRKFTIEQIRNVKRLL